MLCSLMFSGEPSHSLLLSISVSLLYRSPSNTNPHPAGAIRMGTLSTFDCAMKRIRAKFICNCPGMNTYKKWAGGRGVLLRWRQ